MQFSHITCDPPAGPGQQLGGLVGPERGPGRFAQGRDRFGEPGSGLALSAGQRHADGQAATRGRDLTELAEDGLKDSWLQVHGYPLEQEQARPGRVQPGLQQPFGDRVAGEVGFHEAHLAGGEAQPFQPFSLVPLGGGKVDLEPADAGPGVPEGPAVVAGRADDDLAHSPADGTHHDLVEEPGAAGQVVAHPACRGRMARRDVGGQRLVGGRIPVGRRNPAEPETVRGHPPGRDRGTAVVHVRSAPPVPPSPVHSVMRSAAAARPRRMAVWAL